MDKRTRIVSCCSPTSDGPTDFSLGYAIRSGLFFPMHYGDHFPTTFQRT